MRPTPEWCVQTTRPAATRVEGQPLPWLPGSRRRLRVKQACYESSPPWLRSQRHSARSRHSSKQVRNEPSRAWPRLVQRSRRSRTCSRIMYATWAAQMHAAQVRLAGPELPPFPVAEEKRLPPRYNEQQACCLPPSYGDAEYRGDPLPTIMPPATHHPRPFRLPPRGLPRREPRYSLLLRGARGPFPPN